LRVLLVEDNAVEALAIQRELVGRHEVRVATTLGDALAVLGGPGWRPDAVVTDLDLPDSAGAATLQALRDAGAAIPVVVSTGAAAEAVRRHLDALAPGEAHHVGGILLRQAVSQHQLSCQLLKAEIAKDIDHLARGAADAAVTRAVDQLLHRLGLDDEEGFRLAIRWARGWETAKLRFVAAVATGLASAFLLAIGAGIMAMLRQGGSK
jgi:CheY-like chemotaxis protein